MSQRAIFFAGRAALEGKPWTSVWGRQLAARLVALSAGLLLSGCGAFPEWVAVQIFYREVALGSERVHSDIGYWNDPAADPRKHLLDLYAPQGTGWPLLIFVHGGSWSHGDKGLTFGGVDPYGNIGRFYAARGIGVAVINYRLQPRVTWREQVADVIRALGWAYQRAPGYGADRRAIFLSGHSAGAQLAVRAALDRQAQMEMGLPSRALCGVISVSGYPFDLTDQRTYELAWNPSMLEKPFRAGASGEDWRRDASSINLVARPAPPFLLLHGGWEARALKWQNELMYKALLAAGVSSRLIVSPWDSHFLIVASLSHPDRLASETVLDFIHETKCS